MGECFAFLDEPLFEFVDRALGDRDIACCLGFAVFEVYDRFMTFAQPRLCALEFLLERCQGRT